MKVSIALRIFRDYQSANLKPRSVLGYRYILTSFEEFFGERDLGSVSSEDVYHFFEMVTEDNSKSSKRHRHSARVMIKRMGERMGLVLNPHDLRRNSATYASRNGVPLEIVAKVILGHQNLKTTQL